MERKFSNFHQNMNNIQTVEEAKEKLIMNNPNLSSSELSDVMAIAEGMADLLLEFGTETEYYKLVSKVDSYKQISDAKGDSLH
jgi:hypothetical protein